MAVNTVEHLDRHPEKTSGLPLIDSILHQPGCCRVSQSVRCNPPLYAGQTQGGFEGGLHGMHGLTVPLNEVLKNQTIGKPATQMGQQPRWQRYRRLTLFVAREPSARR